MMAPSNNNNNQNEGGEGQNNVRRRIRLAQANSRKGCMRGKGGPENAACKYKGVRQRTWGKWVAEIREPKRGKRVWLGTFRTDIEAAVAYDNEAVKLYGADAKVNLPHLFEDYDEEVVVRAQTNVVGPESTGNSNSVVMSSSSSASSSAAPPPPQAPGGTSMLEGFSIVGNLPSVDDSEIWEKAASFRAEQHEPAANNAADFEYGDGSFFPWCF